MGVKYVIETQYLMANLLGQKRSQLLLMPLVQAPSSVTYSIDTKI